MTIEEENAIRYTAGYVMMKMNKMYTSKGMVDISRCILSMREGQWVESLDGESAKDVDSFLNTHAFGWTWLTEVGCLKSVTTFISFSSNLNSVCIQNCSEI